MRHREAVGYLPDLETGDLDQRVERDLVEHVGRCTACKDWVATYDLLSGALSVDHSGNDEHPDADLLALCVLRPEEVHESDREELRSHLEHCRACRRDIERVRDAVRSARPSEEIANHGYEVGRRDHQGLRRALAAVVSLLLLGGGLVVAELFLGRLHPEMSQARQPATVPVRATPGPAGESDELTGLDLDGNQVIGSDRKLVVSDLTVRRGADVTLRAGELVVFGDGFRVDSGARLTVGSAAPSDLTK